MISDRMTKDIDALIQKETDWAIEHLGHFNSRHEAYAVALEECEETEEDREAIEAHFEMLWLLIKDDCRDLTDTLGALRKVVRHEIAELLQFAAMLDKLELYEQKQEAQDE